ncbi:MAG: hypothetical protein AAF561_04320 [Planctomycetota bacterium]
MFVWAARPELKRLLWTTHGDERRRPCDESKREHEQHAEEPHQPAHQADRHRQRHRDQLRRDERKHHDGNGQSDELQNGHGWFPAENGEKALSSG